MLQYIYVVGKGSSILHIKCRYLSEESIEVQVWSSLVKRRQSDGPRPWAEDTLLGSAYVPLSGILSQESVSGSFPLFKAGVDSLGAQSVHVEIHRTVLSSEPSAQFADMLAQEDSCIEVLVGGVHTVLYRCMEDIWSLFESGVYYRKSWNSSPSSASHPLDSLLFV